MVLELYLSKKVTFCCFSVVESRESRVPKHAMYLCYSALAASSSGVDECSNEDPEPLLEPRYTVQFSRHTLKI